MFVNLIDFKAMVEMRKLCRKIDGAPYIGLYILYKYMRMKHSYVL